MTVAVPWNAWFEDCNMALSFPDAWQVDVLSMRTASTPGDGRGTDSLSPK